MQLTTIQHRKTRRIQNWKKNWLKSHSWKIHATHVWCNHSS